MKIGSFLRNTLEVTVPDINHLGTGKFLSPLKEKIILVALAIFASISLAYCMIRYLNSQRTPSEKAFDFVLKKQYDKAKIEYKKALKESPADIGVLRAYAQSCEWHGQDLRKAGKAEEAAKQFFKAEKQYKKILEVAPNNFHVSQNCGEALYAQGKYDEAAAQFEKTFAINTFPARLFVYHAAALAKAGKVDDAKAKLDQAFENFDDPKVKEKVTLYLQELNEKGIFEVPTGLFI